MGPDAYVLVLSRLAHFTMEGAEFDSSARDPPPSCHPGTRLTILKSITDWIGSKERSYGSLWLNGPAGVGKSAIMQTLAENLSSLALLARCYFSQEQITAIIQASYFRHFLTSWLLNLLHISDTLRKKW